MRSFFPGNQITLLKNGEEYFPALEQALDQAKNEIYLETYIFEEDHAGEKVAQALKRASLRGIQTHLLVDGFGSRKLSEKFIRELREEGVKILKFRSPFSSWGLRKKNLRRLHRKIAVVDREIAFVGGINIMDDIEPEETRFPRYDYAVSVEGPLVDLIRQSARQLWSWVEWMHFKIHWVRYDFPKELVPPKGNMRAAFLVRDNIRHRRDIEKAYLDQIRKAKKEIILANAYFLPGSHFRQALIQASQRGVRVILLLQGRVEYWLLQYASWALYDQLLGAGVEIYEYKKSFMHAKVAVIDDHWSTVGSSNIDPFSLLLSREGNVVVDDPVFCEQLKKSLKEAMQNDSQKIVKENWEKISRLSRALHWLSYGSIRFMLEMLGFAHDSLPSRN